jgi:hypothetical protein
MNKLNFTYFTVLIAATLLLSSCNVLKTAPYDQYSYQKTVEIKVDASNLIDKATTQYLENEEAINSLNVEIQKIVAYEKNKPNNEISYAMWKILSDKEKNLLSGFLKRWQEKGQLSQIFISEAKGQIMEAMDLLIQYEGAKDKEAKESLLQMIANN